jgi:predicted DNA-binding transcriptional regulator AlpA
MNNGSNADISKKTFLKSEGLADFLSISKPTVYSLIEKSKSLSLRNP